MDIARLLDLLLNTLTRRLSGEVVGELEDFRTEVLEMVEHQQREADGVGGTSPDPAGIAVTTISVIHALEIGVEETIKAHRAVAVGRREVEAAIRRVEPSSRVSMVRDTIFESAIAAANTTRAGRALATGINPVDGEPVREGNHREQLLRELCEQIANDIASYASIPDLCSICGHISAGHTCCPPGAE